MFFKIAGSPHDGSKKALPTAKLKMCIIKQILLMFVKDFFLKVAQKKGRTKRTHQIAGFEKMM